MYRNATVHMDEEGAPHLQNSPYIQGSNRYHDKYLNAKARITPME